MKQRIVQLQQELKEACFIFNGPEERSIIKRIVGMLDELHVRLREIEKRWEETD